MTELSLSAINATAPYHLRISELGGFDFDIDAGLTYNIALIEDYRAGLFSRWFRDYADDSKYSLLTTSLKVGNVTNYLGAFLRRDNELYMTSLFPSNNKLYPRIRMVENSGIRSVLCDRSFFLFL